MSYTKGGNAGKRLGRNGLIAVAIDKDKSSQYALRWVVDNLLVKGQTVILIHVLHKNSASGGNTGPVYDLNVANKQQLEKQAKELFLTFHCFCTRKDIQCYDVTLEDNDIAKAITEYVSHAAIENLVFGSSRHGFIKRLKTIDTPTAALKSAPDFCTVYVISKTKISQVRNASRVAPFASPIFNDVNPPQDQFSNVSSSPDARPKHNLSIREPVVTPRRAFPARDFDSEMLRSPFARARGLHGKLHADLSETESDISFISSERPSVDRMSGMFDGLDSGRTSRISTSSESSFGSGRTHSKASDISSFNDFSSSSIENDDVEAEMRRLKFELQKTMEMYSTACKEALTAKQTATELHRWRIEEEQRIKEARRTEEAAGKSHSEISIRTPEASQRSGEFDSRSRLSEGKSAIEEDEDHHRTNYIVRYRKYTIEDIEEATENLSESYKIGEGGYGPVFKCYLDHTAVAVKVLRPDATQGRSQFQQEVEVLSCMRHPHMVLLLGACPEYGCLVYEYMANGSLEDRLFLRGNTPPLPWQLRFRIAAEIATGLLFLHRTKPEPIVHRDLKPANILLDHNFVSKIGDVGLARLVPPSVADDVTQYRMTSAAGTFCYIDPEYQQTGMLGVKSDVYSFAIILLQLITAKAAMGLTHSVQRAIDNGKFEDILDPKVPDWPVEEAMVIAKLGLQCAELRRKDRPDLDTVVLPQLNRLRELADESLSRRLLGG
ncbi:OLC1v1025968C1 [Oldenlandia corymbosa var. corymbosa]|uniref:RING-type E3 ubiquitin transferase n=1 Tax=Oldenlandia corymbosa var. corymbosa TaxID=529605 RepID=A0AAV1C5Y2_OLDCO|nr:OLC1v1025968C1 [Oldenlandia corymbosa var. corymbosa]